MSTPLINIFGRYIYVVALTLTHMYGIALSVTRQTTQLSPGITPVTVQIRVTGSLVQFLRSHRGKNMKLMWMNHQMKLIG